MDEPSENSEPKKESLADFYDAELSISDLLEEDRYVGHELIDSGAVKEVYKVTDTHCAREVAFAKIKEGIFSLESAIDFLREVQTTSGFEHPNIIRIYDVGIKDGVPWFTMELSSGKTLKNLLEDAPYLPLAESLEIFLQLCDAVNYAHERDVLHLDLKPDNVNIGKAGGVLLSDWGLSSSICILPEADLVNAQTQVGTIKGSLGYMAPEQAVPNYEKAPTADIFGLGGILFFLLTGEAPILGDERDEILENTKAGRLKDFVREEIPSRLVPLLGKVLAKNPEDRYPSVAALKSEIVAFRNGFATLAESASTWTKVKLFCRRNTAFCLTVAAACFVLLGSTVYYIGLIKESEVQANSAREEAETQREEANTQRLIAEQALKRFLVAEELNQRTNLEFAETLFMHAESKILVFDLEDALVSVQKAVKRDPDNADALKQLGNIHFMRQEFKDAAHYLKAGGKPESQALIEISEKNMHKSYPLPVDDLTAIFDEIVTRPFFKFCMFQYDVNIRDSKEHSELVAHMLRKSSKLKNLNFQYDAKNETLDLSGNPGLRSVSSDATHASKPFNLLSTLPIRRLILDDTASNRANEDLFRPNRSCRVIFK
ncbi:MAG: protein kinase domain-containing protein [Luteolibacter sp.]